MGLLKEIGRKIEKKEASGREYVKWLNENNADLEKIQGSLNKIIEDLESRDRKDIKKLAKRLKHASSHVKKACKKLDTESSWRKFIGAIPDIDDLRATKDELEGFIIDIDRLNKELEKCEFEDKDELKHILGMRCKEVEDIFHEIRGRYNRFKSTLLPF